MSRNDFNYDDIDCPSTDSHVKFNQKRDIIELLTDSDNETDKRCYKKNASEVRSGSFGLRTTHPSFRMRKVDDNITFGPKIETWTVSPNIRNQRNCKSKRLLSKLETFPFVELLPLHTESYDRTG
jgi:hypothetical protein